jgi:chromosome segregation ATPase
MTGVMAATPTGKVIQLLDELKGKVEADLAAEGKSMSTYNEYCDDELTEKAYAIKTANREIAGLKAAIEDAAGKFEKNTAALEELGTEIAAKQGEVEEATKVRKGENSDFVAAEKELVDAVDTLSRAIVVLKRGLSLLSVKGSSAKFDQLATALDAVVVAAGSWGVSPKSQLAVKSFLQGKASDDDSDLSLLSVKQPQAASYNYESKSGGIVATLGDMKDKAESTLADLRREEMKAKHAFEMLSQSLSDAVSVAERDAANAKANQSAASEAKAKAEGELAATEASKAADEKYSAKLDSQCKTKNAEWDARQKSGAAEIKALSEAKDVLAGGVKVSLASTRLSTKRVAAASLVKQDDGNRYQAVQLLKKLGRQFSSYELLELSNKASSDPFGKVRGLINDMISKLEKQAQEEATHESFCQEELAKSVKSKETKENRADKYQTRIDQATAGIADLKAQIADLQAELSDIAAATKKSTAIRNAENSDYKKASADYKESIDAVTSAIATLTDFYRGASFVQTGAAQPELGAARGDAGHMIIEILAQAESDFSSTLAEIEADEAEAKSAYEELMQDNAVAKSTKEASVKGKQSEIKSLEVALGNHKSDLSTVSKELEAVLDYLSKLKPQCESKAMTYEERKARRESELAGLKEALELLQGSDSFLQTGARKAKFATQQVAM